MKLNLIRGENMKEIILKCDICDISIEKRGNAILDVTDKDFCSYV